ncbi:MAG: alpha/beta hydrolase [Acidobacteriaceae bacterium]
MAKNPTSSKPPAKSSAKQPRLVPRYDPQRGNAPPEMIPLVEMGWILKALAVVFFVAFLCAYATICILFSRSQWQLVLHPSHTVSTTPASLSLPFTEVHFGVDTSGLPQLTGWWIPATTPTQHTALILHSADGNIANALPSAQILHNQNLNVLLFDYRGYGHSLGQHPTEATMEADATTALTYLTNTRNIPTSAIAIYATGLGASIAVRLCTQNPTLPALILKSPDGDLTTRVSQDPRAKLVPFHLLFNQPFPLSTPLTKLQTPHLTLTAPPNPALLTPFLTTHLKP